MICSSNLNALFLCISLSLHLNFSFTLKWTIGISFAIYCKLKPTLNIYATQSCYIFVGKCSELAQHIWTYLIKSIAFAHSGYEPFDNPKGKRITIKSMQSFDLIQRLCSFFSSLGKQIWFFSEKSTFCREEPWVWCLSPLFPHTHTKQKYKQRKWCMRLCGNIKIDKKIYAISAKFKREYRSFSRSTGFKKRFPIRSKLHRTISMCKRINLNKSTGLKKIPLT